MIRTTALALLAAAALTAPAGAQSFMGMDQVSFDAGLGVTYGPDYMGGDDGEASPWFILQNLTIGTDEGEKQGFAVLPSFGYRGDRESDDIDYLEGMDDIDRAGEVGVMLRYINGPFTSYGTLRKGFGGHDGVLGEIGTKYRYDANDKLTLWTAAELQLADDEFTGTYFGVTPGESASSGFRSYDPSGGAYAAEISVEARYMLTPNTSLMGKVSYGRLLNDAADSPLVQDKDQPSISIGVARRLNFRF
ncbi:outer membrane protein [Paracoccus halophilus]|uniref:Outer membrane protein n=1 Tax=Paracoccus halophilus TaxID=376733 RepID=A0A099F3L5_9RHOB|nr:MipA/OmpV family protein [Paracoccus halophilus]KGJ04974.1 structural protein MipA [Paracoccus halophilus]SFA39476.1 outer membrane protein [Paracoccus halophilus]